MGNFFDSPETKCALGIAGSILGLPVLGPKTVRACETTVEKVVDQIEANQDRFFDSIFPVCREQNASRRSIFEDFILAPFGLPNDPRLEPEALLTLPMLASPLGLGVLAFANVIPPCQPISAESYGEAIGRTLLEMATMTTLGGVAAGRVVKEVVKHVPKQIVEELPLEEITCNPFLSPLACLAQEIF